MLATRRGGRRDGKQGTRRISRVPTGKEFGLSMNYR